MGDGQEQWLVDMNLVSDLYQDWIQRLKSIDCPLSAVERSGYLVVDCMVSLETGSIDRLVDDQETVDALMVVGLDRHARKLLHVMAKRDPEDQAEALSKLAHAFDGRLEFEAAVSKYVRSRAS